MSEIENTADFESKVTAITCRLIVTELSKADLAIQLKMLLIENGKLDASVTFEELKKDAVTMALIQKFLAWGLDDKVGRSDQFGLGVVSPFDLYFNMRGKAFKELLKPLKVTMETADLIKASQTKLRRFIVTLRDTVLFLFDMPETPLTRFGASPPKTKASVGEEIHLEISEKEDLFAALTVDNNEEEDADASSRMKEKVERVEVEDADASLPKKSSRIKKKFELVVLEDADFADKLASFMNEYPLIEDIKAFVNNIITHGVYNIPTGAAIDAMKEDLNTRNGVVKELHSTQTAQLEAKYQADQVALQVRYLSDSAAMEVEHSKVHEAIFFKEQVVEKLTHMTAEELGMTLIKVKVAVSPFL